MLKMASESVGTFVGRAVGRSSEEVNKTAEENEVNELGTCFVSKRQGQCFLQRTDHPLKMKCCPHSVSPPPSPKKRG